MSARVPVLIVGGGPVGLALAGELGWRGVPSTLIEKSDGTMGRTVPVIDNTFFFTVGLEDFTLHGIGDAAAEGLERSFPLRRASGRGENRGGCVGFVFAESGPGA